MLALFRRQRDYEPPVTGPSSLTPGPTGNGIPFLRPVVGHVLSNPSFDPLRLVVPSWYPRVVPLGSVVGRGEHGTGRDVIPFRSEGRP